MSRRERISRLESVFCKSVNSQARVRTRNELDRLISRIESADIASYTPVMQGMIAAIQKVRRI